jgi:hypothetical protein
MPSPALGMAGHPGSLDRGASGVVSQNRHFGSAELKEGCKALVLPSIVLASLCEWVCWGVGGAG